MSKKEKAVKKLTYLLIPQDSEVGAPMYEQLYLILDAHHKELSQANARIALAWALSWKPDVDGRLTLGKCKKASDLDRELAPFDFVILLNREWWENLRVTREQRTAILDHELMHAAVSFDEVGEPKVDERGRTVFRMRKHDLEEFADIVTRHGLYKSDIEAFAKAIQRAEGAAATGWIGYSKLSENLKALGLTVSVDVIATWPDAQRRDVLVWSLLRQACGENTTLLQPEMPGCLLEAQPPAEAHV